VEEQQQRLRVVFQKLERVRYISHLDVLRYWERAIRRAELPLAYSKGFTPHPRIAFAAPLPLGFVGTAEIVEITLDHRVSLADFETRLGAQTSADMAIQSVHEVPPRGAPPQSLTRMADYDLVLAGASMEEVRPAVANFLEKESFPWVEQRGEKTRKYDLRAAVLTLRPEPAPQGVRLAMRLACSQDLTGRPEQVVAALFPDACAGIYRRTGIVLAEDSPARRAWRRRGRYL
jgi:radical SAM-linked protein